MITKQQLTDKLLIIQKLIGTNSFSYTNRIGFGDILDKNKIGLFIDRISEYEDDAVSDANIQYIHTVILPAYEALTYRVGNISNTILLHRMNKLLCMIPFDWKPYRKRLQFWMENIDTPVVQLNKAYVMQECNAFYQNTLRKTKIT